MPEFIRLLNAPKYYSHLEKFVFEKIDVASMSCGAHCDSVNCTNFATHRRSECGNSLTTLKVVAVGKFTIPYDTDCSRSNDQPLHVGVNALSYEKDDASLIGAMFKLNLDKFTVHPVAAPGAKVKPATMLWSYDNGVLQVHRACKISKAELLKIINAGVIPV